MRHLRQTQNSIVLIDYIDTDIRTVSKDTLLEDILPLIYDSAAPIAVVENGRLIGVLIKNENHQKGLII